MDNDLLKQQLHEPGLTSLEAAALYVSGGTTKDPQEAAILASDAPLIGQQSLILDKQQRQALRDMMGFNFSIKQASKKIHVYSKEGPKLSTHCKYDGVISEQTVDKLVDACLRLKNRWEAAQKADIEATA